MRGLSRQAISPAASHKAFRFQAPKARRAFSGLTQNGAALIDLGIPAGRAAAPHDGPRFPCCARLGFTGRDADISAGLL